MNPRIARLHLGLAQSAVHAFIAAARQRSLPPTEVSHGLRLRLQQKHYAWLYYRAAILSNLSKESA